MTLYLIPDRAQPIALDELRRAFPGVAWANADAGGPDADALAQVGGALSPDKPPHDPAIEFAVWNSSGWTVVPLLFSDPGAGSGGA